MSPSLNGFGTDQNGNAGCLDRRLAPFRHPASIKNAIKNATKDATKDAIEQTEAVLMGNRPLRFLA